MLNIIKKYINQFKDWKFEIWHTRIHQKLALLFTLSAKERLKLNNFWQPRIGQDAVYFDDDSIKEMKHHLPSRWIEKEMIWFDEDGRYIRGNYFPDYFFGKTLVIGKIENDLLYPYDWKYWEEHPEQCYEEKYSKILCLPILTKREFKKVKKEIGIK